MKIKIILSIASVILGLASGESALVAAQSAKPPIDWWAVQFAFIGCVFGMFFVLGMQILRGNPKYGKFALMGMLPISLFFIASGVSALIISGAVTPASVFILVIGIGALLGVGISSLLFKIRHESKP